jgi:SpoIIAA-like
MVLASAKVALDDEIFLDEPYISIRWRALPKVLYAEWKGFATSAEFRAALLTGVRAIKARHVVGYVSDARMAKVVVPEDAKWGQDVWLPQAVAAGLQRMAIVTASAGLAKAAYDDAATEMNSHGLLMRTFHSVEAAIVWAQSGLAEPKHA